MDDFMDWLAENHPFLAVSSVIVLVFAGIYIVGFTLWLAHLGIWLPLVVIIAAPIIRVAFLYVRFKNDLRR